MTKRSRAWTVAILVVIGYAGTLDHPFVYDDRTTILGNPSLRSLADPRAIFTHDIKRPVVNLSYAIDWALSGARPTAYHVSNLLIHLINALLLYFFVRAALGDRRRRAELPDDGAGDERGALLAAALFAAHPMMTEAVGYTSGRSGMLATTFVLAAMLLLRRGVMARRPLVIAGGLVLWLCGLLSKETAAALPLALWAYDELIMPGTSDERRRRRLRLYLPLVGLLVLTAGARLVLHLHAEQSGVRPLAAHVFTQLVVFWRYVLLFAVPYPQSIAHSVRTIVSPFDPLLALAVAGLIALAVIAWRVRRRWPEVTWAIVWFVLFLAPSSAVPLAEQMSEHRTYEASPGLFLIAGAMLARTRGVALRAASFAVVATLLVLTLARNHTWADPITLWSDGVRNAPDLWTAHYALANEYQHEGRCQEALPEYDAAINLKPTQRAVINAGTCLAQLGRYADAERLFRTAAQIGPAVDPQFNLGLMEAARGNPEAARSYLLQTIALDPAHIRARLALVNLDETTFHDRADALRLCREIARLAPHTDGVEACIRRSSQ